MGRHNAHIENENGLMLDSLVPMINDAPAGCQSKMTTRQEVDYKVSDNINPSSQWSGIPLQGHVTYEGNLPKTPISKHWLHGLHMRGGTKIIAGPLTISQCWDCGEYSSIEITLIYHVMQLNNSVVTLTGTKLPKAVTTAPYIH